MNLKYFLAICAVIFVPAALLGVFWWYIVKRGWGSKWLLATSFTVMLALVGSLAISETSIALMSFGLSILGGIVFYFYLRTSPMGNVLIGKNQEMQSNWATLSEEERNTRRQSTRLLLRDIFLVGFLQTAPVIIGVAIILWPTQKSAFTLSLGAFVIGFSGILKIILRPKHVPSELYLSKSRMIGNILTTVLAWGSAVYILFQGLRAP